jgi:L-alanine-DL-glutamate epimerase-like enolase superfamily enzyme
MKIFFYKSNLEFEYPFTISKGTKTHQPALIICVDHDNINGYGEAPSIAYYNISVEQMIMDLKLALKDFDLNKFYCAEDCWTYLNNKMPNNNFALCAIDMALHDWFAKKNGRKLFETFYSNWTDIPPTDYTIGIDSIELMEQKIKAHPMPIYKIKLGLGNEEKILESISRLTDSKIRIDFNEGLTADRFLELYPLFEKYNIELLEQPLSKLDEDGMNLIFKHTKIDLFADEFCVKELDVEKCINKFHGINIKLTKCGGITPALRMIKRANELGLKVMMGTMNESSIGTAAIAHFLPQLIKVDMDGVLLLKETFASGILYDRNAVCQEPNGLGLGVNIDEQILNEYLVEII